MQQEEWKEIDYMPYEVSNTGKIRHKVHKKERKYYIIHGYANLHLKDNEGKQHTYKIHRLVAQAFLPLIPGKNKVNHKDENKLNNHISNLEWVDDKENMRHYYKNRKNRNVRVQLLISDGLEEVLYPSIGAAAKDFDLDTTTMWGYSLTGRFQTYTIKRIPITVDDERAGSQSNPQ